MFLKHFHLRSEPFAVAPDPAFFYPGPEHREALASLFYVIMQRRGCGLMAAGPGMGKTLVLNCLCEQIASFADVIFLHGPMSGNELIDSLAASLGILEASGRYWKLRAIEQVLTRKGRHGRRTVLIIEGVEQLHGVAIEALQTLIALETREGKLLDVLLAAQPILTDTLSSPKFERLRQSIDVSCRLAPFDEMRTAEYLWHRVMKAGSKRSLFTKEAAGLLATATRGIPRLINQFANQTLTAAWSRNVAQVDEDVVWGVLYDLPVSDLPVADLAEWGRGLSASSPKQLMAVSHV
ncbi:MAG: AAA family ATPase [Bryobacteraceae bacterium]